jgi:hypothetical protein
MEGRRRGFGLAVLSAVAVAIGVAGCGDGSGGAADADAVAVETSNPERTFAPLLELAADEPWRPMDARWFIERSIFWFAEDEGCPDRKIAVGHTLPEQWNPEIDWIFPKGLGGWDWPAYYRNPYDARCELNFDYRFYADQLTRPHDPGPRIEGVRPGEGFYLDLVDSARPGPSPDSDRVTELVYVERTEEGDSGVRLTYWTLYGMHGESGRPGSHEGDWERVHVLLHDLGDDRYEPVAVQFGEPSEAHEVPWAEVRRAGDTHPVIRVARATHDAAAATSGDSCDDCLSWRAWDSLADAPKELWYGFGGAWGDVGPTSASTGPLGPHGYWPSASAKLRELEAGYD